MDDDMRTHIQNYLEDFCNVKISESEELAEELIDYLSERGYDVVDSVKISLPKIKEG